MTQQEQNRVLMLDDDPIFCALFKAHAKNQGLDLETVQDSENLVSYMESGNYTVAIIDYDLHTETGLEVAGTLKEAFPDLPILMVSATNRPWQSEHDELTNIKGQISKWEGYDKLCSTISDAANGIFDPKSLEILEEKLDIVERDYNVHLWSERDKDSWTRHYHSFAAY